MKIVDLCQAQAGTWLSVRQDGKQTLEQCVERRSGTMIRHLRDARLQLVNAVEPRDGIQEIVVQADHQGVVRPHLRILEYGSAPQAL